MGMETIIDGVSMGADITSAVVALDRCSHFSLQPHADSDTHVGTVAIQGSNVGGSNDDDWNDIPVSGGNPAASSGDIFNALVDLADLGFRYIRAVYTRTSGTGTLYGYAFMRG